MLGPSGLAEGKGYYMERGAREDGGGVGRKGTGGGKVDRASS